MQAFAAFIVKNRTQAAVSALFGSLLPMISPAVVGLIALSQNIRETVMVMLWACLIPIVFTDLNTVGGDLTIAVTCLSLLAILIAAAVLKAANSWSLTLLFAVVISALFALSANLAIETGPIIEAINQVLVANNVKLPVAVNAQILTGFCASIIALQTLLALLLSRWWQATLYNPGGLRQEITALRLEKAITWFLVITIIGISLSTESAFSWISLLLLPLLFAGCGFIHWWLHHTNRASTVVFVLLYLMLIMLEPVRLLVGLIAILDSHFDLRKIVQSSIENK